jgi:AcrR family transcriptional regulator
MVSKTPSERRTHTRKPRDDRRRTLNRQKLVEAALTLVAREGAAALTVARLAREVGMDASGFYAHFKNIVECEQAAAETFAGYMRSHLEPYSALRLTTDFDQASARTADLLRSWLRRPNWIVLLGRCQYERSPIGEATRNLLDVVREDITDALMQRAAELSLRGHRLRELSMAAELSMGVFVTVLNRLAAGRERDIGEAAAALVRANVTLIGAEFARMAERDAPKPQH